MILDCDLVTATKINTLSEALSFTCKPSRILQEIMQEVWNAYCDFVLVLYQCILPLLCPYLFVLTDSNTGGVPSLKASQNLS